MDFIIHKIAQYTMDVEEYLGTLKTEYSIICNKMQELNE